MILVLLLVVVVVVVVVVVAAAVMRMMGPCLTRMPHPRLPSMLVKERGGEGSPFQQQQQQQQ